jgi:hypothetical protein
VGGRDQVAQFTTVPAATAAVTVRVVHLLVLHRLEYLNVVNKLEIRQDVQVDGFVAFNGGEQITINNITVFREMGG